MARFAHRFLKLPQKISIGANLSKMASTRTLPRFLCILLISLLSVPLQAASDDSTSNSEKEIQFTVLKNSSVEIDFTQHILMPKTLESSAVFILERGTQNGWIEEVNPRTFIYRPEQNFVGRDTFRGRWVFGTQKEFSLTLAIFIAVTEKGLVAHWDFNDGTGTTARDVSGNGYDGVLINGPRWERGALRFARAADHVEVPPYDAFSFMATEDYTLVLRAWVVEPATSWSGVFTRGRETGRWNGIWLTPDKQWAYAHAEQNLVGGSAQPGQWIHIVAVNANNVQKLYVDGRLMGQSSRHERTIERASIWFGGAKSVAEFAQIILDDARIYNYALNETKISDLYMASLAHESNGLKRDYWIDIPGDSVSYLTNHSHYPFHPSGSDVVPSAESTSWNDPGNSHSWADEYGQKLHGWLQPPISGQYVFFISGDDFCQLFLSTDESDANLSMIANVPGWTPHRYWKKYPSQQSVPITLDSRKRYRIVILHKESWGADHVSVGWLKPGESGLYPSEIIPSTALIPEK